MEGAEAGPEEIEVKGRILPVSSATRGVARFSFAELCAEARAANDYLAVARRYHTLVLGGVPMLGPENRDLARRFMLQPVPASEDGIRLLQKL